MEALPETKAEIPEWEKLGMTFEEFSDYIIKSSLTPSYYHEDKTKKGLKCRLTKIWRNGRRKFLSLFQYPQGIHKAS